MTKRVSALLRAAAVWPAAACLFWAGGPAAVLAAESRQRVVVLDFISAGQTNDPGESAEVGLRLALKATGKFTLVPSGGLEREIREQFPGTNWPAAGGDAANIGRILKADLVAVGSAAQENGAYILDVKFMDVKTAAVIYGGKISSKDKEELRDLCGRLVERLLTAQALADSQEAAKRLRARTEESDAANYLPPGRWELGGFYPGAAIRYAGAGKNAWELRGQSGLGIAAYGLRYYRYPKQYASPRVFYGVEADYLTFTDLKSSGAGFSAGFFAGGEYALARRLRLVMDFGPMLISLRDKEYSQSEAGLEFVVNLGLYWRFK